MCVNNGFVSLPAGQLNWIGFGVGEGEGGGGHLMDGIYHLVQTRCVMLYIYYKDKGC